MKNCDFWEISRVLDFGDVDSNTWTKWQTPSIVHKVVSHEGIWTEPGFLLDCCQVCQMLMIINVRQYGG